MPWSMLDPVAFLKIAVRVALDPALMVAGLATKLTMVGPVGIGTSGLLTMVSSARKLSASTVADASTEGMSRDWSGDFVSGDGASADAESRSEERRVGKE